MRQSRSQFLELCQQRAQRCSVMPSTVSGTVEDRLTALSNNVNRPAQRYAGGGINQVRDLGGVRGPSCMRLPAVADL